MSKLNKYIIDPRIKSSFYTPNNLTFKWKNPRRQVGGEGGVIAEDNEWVKMEDGSIARINNAPTHDDKVLVSGNRKQTAKSGKGGVAIKGVESVISATHENRRQKDKSYTYKDEEIKIKSDEAVEIAMSFGFKIAKPNKGISPSKLLDLILEAKNTFLKQYVTPNNTDTLEAKNSVAANTAVVNSLTTDEELYDGIFGLQESKKSSEVGLNMQRGGYKFIQNPVINSYPFKPGTPIDGYFDSRSPDQLSIDSNIPEGSYRDEILSHENEHRESFYRDDFSKQYNNDLLNSYKNTPPYNQEIYNSIGDNEELSAFINSGGHEDKVNNFISKRKQELYKSMMMRQNGGGTLTSDDRSDFKRWLDGKTIGLRTYDHNMSNAAKDVWGAYDKTFPKTIDKVNNLSAIASYFKNPYIAIPATILNTGIDVYQGNGYGVGADVFHGLSKFTPSKLLKFTGLFEKTLHDYQDISNTDLSKKQVGGKLSKYLKQNA